MAAFTRKLGFETLTGKFLWSIGAVLLILFSSLYGWSYSHVSKPITDQFMEEGKSFATALAGTIESVTEQDIRNGITLSTGDKISGPQLRELLFDDSLTPLSENEAVAELRQQDPEYAAAKQLLFDGSEIPLWQYEQKFTSVYEGYTDERWQGIIDSLALSDAVVFALPIAFSENKEAAGFIATHNTEYSPVGESSVDKWGSEDILSQKYRANRVFNDAIGYRAAAYTNKEAPLVQTYPRVIEGKIVTMWDISYPLYFDGDHWGAVRIAMSKEKADMMIAKQREQLLMQYGFMFISIMLMLSVLTKFLVQRRIKRLTATTKQIFAAGKVDLSQRFTLKGRDEISQLSAEINTLVQHLSALVHSIRTTSNEVSASSRFLLQSINNSKDSALQFHTTMQSVSRGAEQQAAGAHEGASAMNEMAGNVRHIANFSVEIAESSQETLNQFEEGSQNAEHAGEQIQDLLASTLSARETILRLNQLSGEIGSFASFIHGIASKTNILSLNASIEASRAGEHGKGFQVIAGEIRNLAEQTQQSSDKIMDMILDIQKQTSSAASSMEQNAQGAQASVHAVQQVTESLKRILEATQLVDANVQHVSATSQELTASVEQVKTTITDIASISDTSANHISAAASSYQEQLSEIERMAEASTNLSRLASQLEASVLLFRTSEDNN
ncbi:methyl-accepting chemotaxis protein [Paenibacillus sambharensis]|uniref:Methyl-accepting chemotaxis protein n=1 Tax=Paenibacillus sambharensis TaxID=1803190 RepID=A0A2W1LQY8_9BACL|nr:methyl-accepting chemotaxis protein [Paenibacillus sambharensis]PZD97372.1 methyl-accepting chemotaxis protein [Paenibacillus sambharensis]